MDALTTILGKMHQDAAAPEMIEVFCYSQHFRALVRTRFQQLSGPAMARCSRTASMVRQARTAATMESISGVRSNQAALKNHPAITAREVLENIVERKIPATR